MSPPVKIWKYISEPKSGDDGWKVEEMFRNWGKKLKKTGDEFDDWVAEVREEEFDKQREAKLRELFMEDLKNGE